MRMGTLSCFFRYFSLKGDNERDLLNAFLDRGAPVVQCVKRWPGDFAVTDLAV